MGPILNLPDKWNLVLQGTIPVVLKAYSLIGNIVCYLV